MARSEPSAFTDVHALFFDVFGTVVDWRSTTTDELQKHAQEAVTDKSRHIPNAERERAAAMTRKDWGEVAAEIRSSYFTFVKAVAADSSIPYKTIDEVNLETLQKFVKEKDLTHLWPSDEIKYISQTWHRLSGWTDTVAGLHEMKKRFKINTLSNGNADILENMAKHAGLPWTNIISAEHFKSYKPDPKVYLSAAAKLGLKPEQCAMVACHLHDLEAAKGCGFKTVYVSRPQEEQWDEAKIQEAKKAGWVNIWIDQGNEGFLSAAKELGIN